jgi:hypothetical protein
VNRVVIMYIRKQVCFRGLNQLLANLLGSYLLHNIRPEMETSNGTIVLQGGC